jgi:hypothetical protein
MPVTHHAQVLLRASRPEKPRGCHRHNPGQGLVIDLSHVLDRLACGAGHLVGEAIESVGYHRDTVSHSRH